MGVRFVETAERGVFSFHFVSVLIPFPFRFRSVSRRAVVCHTICTASTVHSTPITVAVNYVCARACARARVYVVVEDEHFRLCMAVPVHQTSGRGSVVRFSFAPESRTRALLIGSNRNFKIFHAR